MRISIPIVDAIQSSARALRTGKLRFARSRRLCLAIAGFACATILSATSFAQQGSPLNFGDNFFVTGDYIVAGAKNMTTTFSGGYAVGTISIPDGNPGIHGITSVPAGAEVVGAFLYWQTVESAGTIPGHPGSGENGFFRPLITGGPAMPGYPITGVPLPGQNEAVTWSSGSCAEPQGSRLTRTYRANVLGAFPQDAKGNVLTNGQFEIRLPSVGNSTPLTLGASLVIIYRVLSPNVPLSSIVIYDGSFGQSEDSLVMRQTVQGFYDAAPSPVSKMTLIAGAGKSNKFETVYLDNVALPSHSGTNLPPFPGYYGNWDNPTWTFGDPNFSEIANPVQLDAASATAQVVPAANNPGCVSWGAVIFKTTVNEPDGDGLLKSWKTSKPPGYCDASMNGGICLKGVNVDPGWVALPGAVLGEKDLFIQLDYMCSKTTGIDSCTAGDGTNYSFDPRPSGAAALMTNPFSAHGVHVHINPAGTIQPVHAIEEQTCADVKSPTLALCPFPDQAGVVGWKGGYSYFKNQLVETILCTGASCFGSSNKSVTNCLAQYPAIDCQPRFQHGRKDSWHYALFAHAVGRTEWKIQDGTLTSVVQSGNTVTFTTSAPLPSAPLPTLNDAGYDNHSKILADPYCGNGRVSIYYAATNTNLNGTFCITTSSGPGGHTFSITVPGPSESATYTLLTDPYFSVAPGQTSSASGISDVGGADSLITLGLWGDPTSATSNGRIENTIAGTFMHETGHSLGLTHGGFYYDQPAGNYTPTIESNCKPNFQSVMNYDFQVDLLNGTLDYSEQQLDSINESSLPAGVTFGGAAPKFASSKWYSPVAPNNTGTAVTTHCDGTPATTSAYLIPGLADPASPEWAAGSSQDVDFDGIDSTLRGYSDWVSTSTTTGIDLRQIGATGNGSVFSQANFFGGGQPLNGGGQPLNGGGQPLNGGGQPLNGGGQPLNGGGQPLNGGGQPLNGGGEINQQTADSYTRPPTLTGVTEGTSPRTITLTWLAPTFGQIGTYNIYRSPGGGNGFTKITTINAPTLTYTDTVACNPAGYQYFVTSVLSLTSTNPGQESVPSNIGTLSGNTTEPLTGCYTNASPGTVALNNLAFTDTNSSNASMPVQGDNIQVTWSLKTDDTGVSVTQPTANAALVVIGPIPYDGNCPANAPEFLGSNNYMYPVTSLPISGSGAFSAMWNTTNFNAGCYFFELDLDSKQYEQTAALGLDIFVSNNTPHILPTPLPSGIVGDGYSATVQESGGTVINTVPFSWTIVAGSVMPGSGSTLPGIMFQPNLGGVTNGTLAGTSCQAGSYSFMAKVTDSKMNFGTQALSLQILQATTTTSVASSSPMNTSTYGQQVTFTATVAPQYGCTPTGTVTFYDAYNGAPAMAISGAVTLSNAATAMFTTTATQLMAGTHSITAVYSSGDSNFSGSTSPMLSQTVYPKPVTPTLTAASKTYDGTNTETNAMSCTVAVVQLGDTVNCTATSGTFDGPNVGPHVVTATATISGASVSNYTLGLVGTSTTSTSVMGNSSITTKAIIVALAAVNKTYDTTTTEPIADMSCMITSGVLSADLSNVTCTPTSGFFNTSQVATAANVTETAALGGTAAGNYTLGAAGTTTTSITAMVPAGIIPAPLAATITGTQVYGGTGITYTPAYMGFINPDDQSVVTGTLSCTTNASATSAVGSSYKFVSCSGLIASNYSISYSYGTFTVTPAPLTATVSGNESSAPPTFAVSSVAYVGFVNGDGTVVPSVVNGTLSCAVVVPAGGGTAGSNPISCTGLSAGNYNISYGYGGLSPIVAATPAPLTVNVVGSVQTGGGSPVFTLTSYTFTGFTGSDTSAIVTGTLSCTSLALTDSSGNYPISCTGLTATGYIVSYSYSYGASSAATPTPLTVAVNGTVQAGDTPTFTVNSLTYSGFINTDTVSVVNGTLSCSLGTAVSNIYPISCLGLTAASYNVSYDFSASTGTSLARPSPLIVTVTGTPPSVTYSVSGLVNGDAPTVVNGTLACTAGTADVAGNVPISCAGLSATNYNIAYSYSYLPGLDITSMQATLTVNVIGTVPHGSTDKAPTPPLTITSVTYSGFVNDDTLSAVTGALSCTTQPGPNAIPPSFVISGCSGITVPGYYAPIKYWFGKVTVAP